MKPFGTTLSQPLPSARNRIRRGNSIFFKGDATQHRDMPTLQIVEEEAGVNDAVQSHVDSQSPPSLLLAAAVPVSFGQESVLNASSGVSRATPGESASDHAPGTSLAADVRSSIALDCDSTPVQFHVSGAAHHLERPYHSPNDSSTSASGIVQLRTSAFSGALAAGDSSSLAKVKSIIEQKYSSLGNMKSRMGRRGQAATSSEAASTGTSEESVALGRSRASLVGQTPHSSDGLGWMDKMKKNIVGLFEGGDSDASSSDDEVVEQPAADDEVVEQPAAAPAAKLQQQGAGMNFERLVNIIEAFKAAEPQLICDHKKNSRFAMGPSSEVLPLTFKGSDFVEWLVDRGRAGEFSTLSRATAVGIGEEMSLRKLLRNVDKDALSTVFKDGDSLYRCTAL
jgi:hypothetical protein